MPKLGFSGGGARPAGCVPPHWCKKWLPSPAVLAGDASPHRVATGAASGQIFRTRQILPVRTLPCSKISITIFKVSQMIILKVPFAEKEKAKALGARWNSERKSWYVPDGKDIAPFKQWHDPNQNGNAIGAPKVSVKKTPASADSHAGVAQTGKHYIKLNHDCDPFIECLECKPLLDSSGWNAAASVLK